MSQVINALFDIRNETFGFFDQVVLFGSSLATDSPNDIDILLVYGEMNLEEVQSEKAKVEQALGERFRDYVLDFTTLNKSELQETDFLGKVPHWKLRG